MRYLKIEFRDMRLTLGLNGNVFQHYTVRNLEVLAECKCNGHQTTCDRSNVTSQYECVCGGNTMGENCEECLPFYNQKPFLYGIACEACNCYGHADSCYYDAGVAAQKTSLNALNVFEGGGVCVDCRDNTTGINCNDCLPYHYRPITNNQYQSNPCLRCDCSGPGIRLNTVTGLLGDCVMNNDGTLPVGVNPGDCFCKANVMGKNCDKCKVGYYNLQPTNPDGCQECACNVNGTIASTIECDALVTGNCPCKANVEERRCDRCKDNFYGLSADNIAGCTACNCDPGGAFDLPCNKATGQCSCRKNILGLQCTEPSILNYYPDLHFINSEFEHLDDKWDRATPGYFGFGYAPLETNGAATTDISTPTLNDFSGKYYLLVRYSNPAAFSTTSYLALDGYRANILTQGNDISFPPCNTWCYVQVGVDTNLVFNMADGENYRVRVSVNGTVKLDRVVALPIEFVDTAPVLGADGAQEFAVVCDAIDNDISGGTDDGAFCLKSVFSLTARYLRGALFCNCDETGSLGGDCESYGGQCNCKPGVMGRRCNECQLEFHSLSATGCQPCNCQTTYKICNAETGQCTCPPLAQGKQCEECTPNAWNWNATLGCEACNCDPVGSMSLQCNAETGICSCKPGVTGAKCDQCFDDFTGFSNGGCSPCQCDPDGSTSSICSKTTAQCPCKKYVGGLRCDQCAAGAFNNDIDHQDGCLKCVCMGITNNCRSSSWRYSTSNLEITNTNAGTTLHVTANGITVLQDVNTTQVNGYTAASIQLGEDSRNYWSHSNHFRGNLLGIYEGSIEFTVRYVTEDKGADPLDANLIIVGRNKKQFFFNAGAVPEDVYYVVDVEISMENMLMNLTGENTTRSDLLLALTDVDMVLIPASFYPRSHKSYIGNIKYTVAKPSGLGALAVGVEQCTCPLGYSGSSCEVCSDGYRRYDQIGDPYLGKCEKCECYNHASICDPDTGACVDCQHKTQGYSCEECIDGFFGVPTRGTQYDCSECPCYTPRVVNSTCSLENNPITLVDEAQCTFCAEGYMGRLCDTCAPFYFGNPKLEFIGTCQKCFCNNNTNQCSSVNGVCLGCDFNTTGNNCERCAPGFYGNATERTCTPCDCDLKGSLSTVCNHIDGQCECQPGVGGRVCDACIENYYGYDTGDIGCTDCACNEFGSVSLQCNQTGVCTCLDGVNSSSAKCDLCNLGNFGLPNQACEACACNATGSLNLNLPCELVSGQCGCKPGVGGRQCDECQRMYHSYGESGCERCGECEFSLGNDSIRVQDLWKGYYNETNQVYEVQQQDEVLQNVSTVIQDTLNSLGASNDQLKFLQSTLANLNLKEGIYNSSIMGILERVTLLVDASKQLQAFAEDDLLRLQNLNLQAHTALDLANEMTASLPDTIAIISTYNVSSGLLLDLGRGIYIGLNTSFEDERRKVQDELTIINVLGVEIAAVQTTTNVLSAQIADINATIVSADTQFTTLSDRITTLNIFLRNLDIVIKEVESQINSSVINKKEAEALLASTMEILTEVSATLTQAENDYNTGALAFQDCNTLIDGPSGAFTSLPIDPTLTVGVDLTGITSWIQAANKLNITLGEMDDTLTAFSSRVSAAEARVSNYEQQAQEILEVYDAVKARGQGAVDALENYEQVVATLQESYNMAVDALATMKATSGQLNTVSVADLEAKATTSLQNSLISKDEASVWNNAASTYVPILNAANISLISAITTWDDINTRKITFDESAAAVAALAVDSGVTLDLSAGNTAADAAIRVADQVLSSDRVLQRQVANQETTVDEIETAYTNAKILENTITTEVDAFQKELRDSVQNSLDTIQNDYLTINSTIPLLDARIAALEEKILKAKGMLAELEQPVRYGMNTYEEMDNPDADKALKYTEISFDFKYNNQPSGVLFFGETTTSAEKVLLQIVNTKLVFEFAASNGEIVTMTSPVELCFDCWFQVYASRYENHGQLSVTKTSTGGRAVTSQDGTSDITRISIGSPLYVGGIPSNYSMNKVYDTGLGFAGCIYNIQYNGLNLLIWQKLLSVDSTASCCARPPASPVPPSIDAVCFYGFGFMTVQMDAEFSVVTSAEMSIQFRTFSPNAVIFVVDSPNTEAYYGLYVVNGQVVMVVSSGGYGTDLLLSSGRIYNDGEWYQATLLSNITYATMTIEFVDKTINTQIDFRSNNARLLNLTGLFEATMTFGGQNPDIGVIHGPVSDSFAGCMRNWRHTSVSSPGLKAYPLVDKQLQKYQEVNYDSCFDSVISGLGVYKEGGYGALQSDQYSVVSTLEFDLYTYDPSGVLLYAHLLGSSDFFVYVGLFNGDVYLIFNQGLGVQPPVRTIGKYLADGNKHTISIDFRFQTRNETSSYPALSVDGDTIYGSVTMSENMRFTDGTMYVGGIPPNLGFNPDNVPAPDSNVGGVRNVKVNGVLVDMFGPVLQRQNRKFTYLSGLPAPLDVPPPPPYPTTPAPPTTPEPTCAAAIAFAPSLVGVRFGEFDQSYVAYNLPAGQENFFLNAFSLRISFRAVQPNGLLAYFASADVPNPIEWFAVYIYGGYIYISMKSNVNTVKTRNIRSVMKYDNGQWWDLELLRINNFMAVIVPSIRDYNNNALNSNPKSNVTVGSKIYVGGVPASLTGIPFTTEPSDNPILSGMSPFHGCIRSVVATTHDYVNINFGAQTPVEDVGTSGCYDNVVAGTFFNETEAFVRVESNAIKTFSLVPSFKAKITFKGVSRNGVLMAAWQSNEQYMLVALEDGRIVVSLRNTNGDKQPSSIYYNSLLNDFIVCNDQPHTMEMTISETGLSVTVDSGSVETTAYRQGFVFTPIYFIKVYAGGLPNGVTPPIGQSSFNGCIQEMAINNVPYALSYSSERFGIISGCPASDTDEG